MYPFCEDFLKTQFYHLKKTNLCELCLATKRVSFKEENTKEEKQLLILYENHLENSIAQRRAFKEDILKLIDEKAMIVVDFKQNIRLGGSPEEVSAIFYTPTMINYISFFIKTKNNGFFYDFTSQDLSKDAFFIIKCLRTI